MNPQYLILLSLLLISCNKPQHDFRLENIARIASIYPNDAITSLNSIDPDKLSDSDRHFYHLLSIKAKDNAYLKHKSDSLILNVINFYSKRPQDIHLYSEALYYGGRIYYDIGAYNTAIQYFQSALNFLPPKSSNFELRGNVLRQTGNLLNEIGLYNQAVHYLKEALHIYSFQQNAHHSAYDNQTLGCIYIHTQKYDSAYIHFQEALRWAKYLQEEDISFMKVHIAAAKNLLGHNREALNIIRNLPDSVSQTSRNISLKYASKIYLDAGILDTAYIYAHELALSKDPIIKTFGLKTILSPQLSKFIPSDSMNLYCLTFSNALEQQYKQQNEMQTIVEKAKYKYLSHKEKNENANLLNKTFNTWSKLGLTLISTIFLLFISILHIKIKHKNNILKLHEEIDCIRKRYASIDKEKPSSLNGNTDNKNLELNTKEATTEIHHNKINFTNTDKELMLREEFRKEIIQLCQNSKEPYPVSKIIIESEAYNNLKKYIENEKPLSDNNPLWNDLEQIVEISSNKFKLRLQLLAGGSLKSQDLKTAILIKCGVTPTQMASLLGRSKGSITYRRDELCIKILGEKLGTKIIDYTIRML